ncbi:MAG: hypothetical protein WC797_01875 [Candidatus Paceibacterota bacterium]
MGDTGGDLSVLAVETDWRERLPKADETLVAAIGLKDDPLAKRLCGDFFEVFIIIKEDTSDVQRAELRRLVSVSSMGPQVACATVSLDQLTIVDKLDYVEKISAVLDERFRIVLDRLMSEGTRRATVSRREVTETVDVRVGAKPTLLGKFFSVLRSWARKCFSNW